MDRGTGRHFPEGGGLDLRLREGRQDFVVRLLEDGHGGDLRWLSSQCSETEIKRLYRERGARQLSRRSRAFWSVVLGEAEPVLSPLAEALWPL